MTRPSRCIPFHPRRTLDLFSFAAFWLGVSSLGACTARLEVTDDNVGGASAAGDGGSGPGVSGGAGDAGGSGGSSDVAACDDGIQNGTEAGVDCGGSCSPCEPQRCTNGPVECDSYVCVNGLCQPPSCEDGVRNGEEAGVDCGGASACGPCLTLCHEQCAVSDRLIPVGCDPGAPPGWPQSARTSEDGSVVAFDHCETETLRCNTSRWTLSEGPRPLAVTAGAALVGLSEDGQLVLARPPASLGAEALLFAADGTSIETGMAPEPALLGAGGAVVGVSPAGASSIRLLRRAPGGEVEPLGDLPTRDLAFTGATPDASVIVGYSSPVDQPFVYTASGGLVFGLEGLPETADSARIHALSRDGSAFAGLTFLGNERVGVFRWTQASGVVEVGVPLLDEAPGLQASLMALSDDGSVLAFSGSPGGDNDVNAYRWSAETGAQELIPGSNSLAALLSADGSLVIGKDFGSAEEYSAFFWTEQNGARSIRAELEDAGVDLRGWSIGTPQALSRNGRVAVGVGSCGGIQTVYRLVLPE